MSRERKWSDGLLALIVLGLFLFGIFALTVVLVWVITGQVLPEYD